MHKGTPIIMHGDLVIFHEMTKAGRMIYYSAYQNKLRRDRIGSYNQPKIINGDDFNPEGIVSFPWQQIVPRNMLISKQFDVKFIENPERRSRLLNFVGMTPDQWPVIDWEDPHCLDAYPPQQGWFRHHDDQGAHTMDGKYSVDVSNTQVQISKWVDPKEFGEDWQAGDYVPYDPALEHQAWENDPTPMIELAISKYDKFCEEKWGVASTGGRHMDYAHMDTGDKTGIVTEFAKQIKGGCNIMTAINRIAQKRCSSSKAWHRTQGKNMRAAVLMVLAEAGNLKLSI